MSPSAVVTYGIADDEAWSVGLPCGGEIDVFVEPFTAAPPIERGTSYVVVAGEGLGERWHDDTFERTELREEDARTVFAEAIAPPPRLVAVGAGDIAEALCALARPLGWRTIVVDPRAGLATRERVPSADEIVVAWPDEIEVDADTAVISLVHEERLDIPALRAGVEGGAFYVGALGSRRAQEKRREHLGDARGLGARASRARPRRRRAGRDRTRDPRRDPADEKDGWGARRRPTRDLVARRALDGRGAVRWTERPVTKPSAIMPTPSTMCSQLSAAFTGSQSRPPMTPISQTARYATPPPIR